ncbi:MAG TPA: putative glycolipid-binding domain-containing protein, partial [Bacillales bacterium]|nr:putative glycolipid-binding domain-containing protein [Bacillales bacterium]
MIEWVCEELYREVLWDNKENFGCEYLKINASRGDIFAEGTVIYLEHGEPCKVDYAIQLDAGWRTKKLNVKLNDKQLRLYSNGKG